jgi:hypothetical protein
MTEGFDPLLMVGKMFDVDKNHSVEESRMCAQREMERRRSAEDRV